MNSGMRKRVKMNKKRKEKDKRILKFKKVV
jgi:hypothetical protein